MKLKAILTAALLLAPTPLAAPGIVTVSTGLRPAPARLSAGRSYPGRRPCQRPRMSDGQCLVRRKLVRRPRLGIVAISQYLYRNKYVYLPDYVDLINVPSCPSC